MLFHGSKPVEFEAGLLKNNHTLKVGMKHKRHAVGWDDSYLEQVLFGR